MAHANARTNLFARRLIVERVAAGWPAAHVAEQLGVSRATVHKWVRRHAEGGDAALADRSSRPVRMPNRTSHKIEKKVLAARRRRQRGAVVLAAELGLNPSTVGRILARHDVPHLAAIDPITGERIRSPRRSQNRYEHPTPGAMIHVDVKKLGKIPPGGGWRLHGRKEEARGRGMGYDYVHTAIDDHSRLAYAEIHDDEKGTTAAGLLARAAAFYASHGIQVERVISDNAFAYRNSRDFKQAAVDLGIVQKFIRPHCPWTNGKVERLNLTLATEWAYSRVWSTNPERAAALPTWLEHYNLERPHLGIGGQRPIDRVNNAAGQYT